MIMLNALRSGNVIPFPVSIEVSSPSDQKAALVLNGAEGEIANYWREGGDVIIELKSGGSIKIKGFFDDNQHELILVRDDQAFAVRFANAFESVGDAIAKALIQYVLISPSECGGNKGGWSATPLTPPLPPVAPTITGVRENVGPHQGLLNSGALTDDARPTFSGTGTAGNSVVLRGQGGKELGRATVDANGNWTIDPKEDLRQGTQKFTVVQIDKNGKESAAATFGLMVDTLAPPAPVIENSNGRELTGTAEAGALVLLRDANYRSIAQAIADARGNFAFDGNPLKYGESGSLVARDVAGNVSQATPVRRWTEWLHQHRGSSVATALN